MYMKKKNSCSDKNRLRVFVNTIIFRTSSTKFYFYSVSTNFSEIVFQNFKEGGFQANIEI